MRGRTFQESVLGPPMPAFPRLLLRAVTSVALPAAVTLAAASVAAAIPIGPPSSAAESPAPAATAGPDPAPAFADPAGAALPPLDTATFQHWHRALRSARPDPARGATVENLTLRRDAATLELVSDELHLLQPVDGRTVGAVFVGEGRFRVTPPTAVEQEQLGRFYETPTHDVPVRRAVLFFTDGTLEELSAAVEWEEREPPSDARREVEEALKYVSDDEGWADRDVMLPLLNDRPGFFYAHVADDRDDPVILEVAPHRFEEVSLYRRATAPRPASTAPRTRARSGSTSAPLRPTRPPSRSTTGATSSSGSAAASGSWSGPRPRGSRCTSAGGPSPTG